MAYLIAAYIVLWAVSFGLVGSMVWRQRKLRADVRLLRQLLDDEPHSQA